MNVNIGTKILCCITYVSRKVTVLQIYDIRTNMTHRQNTHTAYHACSDKSRTQHMTLQQRHITHRAYHAITKVVTNHTHTHSRSRYTFGKADHKREINK